MTLLPVFAAGVAVGPAAAEGQDSAAGLGDGAEKEHVLFQPNHGTGEGARPGQCEGKV